jgi:MoxR-like ATPase
MKQLKNYLNSQILGQETLIEQVLVTLLCHGHGLITGQPGLGKTKLVRTLAQSLNLSFKRIQFTPDLTPYDILGGETFVWENQQKNIQFVPGPIFSSFVLADEINRASPRTQSAFLEAMQEKTVSYLGKTMPLPHPFFVFATQNPLEHEGTFPLPEAHKDRFLLEMFVDYPDFENEKKISILSDTSPKEAFQWDGSLLDIFPLVEKVPLPEKIHDFILRIVRNTRPESTEFPFVKKYFEYGASPRASQGLVKASKALSYLRDESEVSLKSLFDIALPILRHRIGLNFQGISDGISLDASLKKLLEEVIL